MYPTRSASQDLQQQFTFLELLLHLLCRGSAYEAHFAGMSPLMPLLILLALAPAQQQSGLQRTCCFTYTQLACIAVA